MPDDLATLPGLQLRPLSPALGVEVQGLDLSQPIPPSVAEALRGALRQHLLLLFRGQAIEAPDQSRFARLFGKIEIRTSHYQGVAQPEFADQQHVSNNRADGILSQGELTLHGDHFWHEVPLTALILYAMEVPSTGGDTRFCHSGLAHAAMPPALQARLEGLRSLTMYDFRGGDYTAAYDTSRIGQPGVMAASHPLVWTDPEDGSRAIWYNGTSTVALEGLPAAERPALDAELRRYLDDPRWNYQHRWQPGDLILWNNRRLLHARTPFDPTQKRTLRRTPLL